MNNLLLLLIFFGMASACQSAEPPQAQPAAALVLEDSLPKPKAGALPCWLGFHRDFRGRPFRGSLRTNPERPIEGTLVLLPGWNYKATDWCEKTRICDLALADGYAVLMLEAEKSTYSDSIYPQTRADWRQYVTRLWLQDTLIPWVQREYGLLRPGERNFALGLSTGGRGAALLGLYMPQVFVAVASLSGDFDQWQMPQDGIMRGYYGEAQRFPQRWKGADNLHNQVERWNCPIYLGHGALDKVVPPSQTEQFYRALKACKPQLVISYRLAQGRGHDYPYWASEAEAVWKFFMEQGVKKQ
jgi:S-formylglutathione hydrolase FrmB